MSASVLPFGTSTFVDETSPPACRMERLATFAAAVVDAIETMDDDEADQAFAETLAPLWRNLFHETPETSTMAGATAALRALLLDDDLDEGPARVIRSVLIYLEPLAPEVSTARDPFSRVRWRSASVLTIFDVARGRPASRCIPSPPECSPRASPQAVGGVRDDVR